MRKLVFLYVLLGLATCGPALAQHQAREQLIVPLTDPDKPGFIDVNQFNGFIHVVGYSGKEVVIEATSDGNRGGRPSNEHQNAEPGMRRITNKTSVDLSAEERNNRIKVNANTINSVVNLTIKVPQRFSLRLHAFNEGDIRVENVVGELEVNNVNGAIELINVGGAVVGQTVNGDLKASFREVSSNTPMAFSTLNGRVDVTFPASVKANVKLKSDMGEIFSDFDIDVVKSQAKATRSSQSGMYRVSIDDWVYGKINGGGPEIMMKSMQGNIYVRKGK